MEKFSSKLLRKTSLTLCALIACVGAQASGGHDSHVAPSHSPAPSHTPEKADHKADHGNKVYDVSTHPEVAPEEVFSVISELSDVWNVEKLEGQRIDPKLRQAQVAAKGRDFLLAEQLFIEALNRDISKKERYWALLQMAAMYQREGDKVRKSTQNEAFMKTFGERAMLHDEAKGAIAHLVKAATVYEKFNGLYDKNDLVPFVNLQLGRIYRNIGTYELAKSRFYNVITAALNIRPANIPAYQDVVVEAKQEIAETYFLQGKYKEAAEFYARLKLLDIDNAARQEALFKVAYCQYMLDQHGPSQRGFEKFLVEFPDSILAPESHYLLADLYTLQNQPQKAVGAVLALLSEPSVKNPEDEAIWLYWQKKAGNELANEFYEQNDYMSALRIYQAMWTRDDSAQWRAPTMYQVGLCFAHLEAPLKAKEVFSSIIQGEFWDEDAEPELYAEKMGEPVSEDVRTIQELAAWHAKQIDWNTKAGNRIQSLMYMSEDGS